TCSSSRRCSSVNRTKIISGASRLTPQREVCQTFGHVLRAGIHPTPRKGVTPMTTATAAPAMKGPVKSVLWFHNAILKETSAFQEGVEGLASDHDHADASALLRQFKFFRKVLEVHEEGEDRDVFPLLDERYVHVTDTYGYDHRRQQALYQEIERALQGLSDRGLGGRAHEIGHLQRRAEAFGVLMEIHVAKENELLFPLYDRTFSVE